MTHFYKLFRYTLVGGGIFIVQFATLLLLVESDYVSPILASGVAFLVALLLSFFLQRKITFQKKGREGMGQELILTAALSLFNLFFNVLGMYLLLSFSVHYLMAQVIVTGVIVMYTYVAYHFIFRIW